MSQKPVHQRRQDETRDAIWAAIRRFGRNNETFSVRDIANVTRLGIDTIRDYLTGLTAAGYLESAGTVYIPGSRKQAATFRLVRDCGVDAPRVRKDGSEIIQGRGRENMWLTIPILQEFSARELAFSASTEAHRVAESEAECYCSYLARAGYIAVVVPGKPGSKTTAGTTTRYRHRPSKYTGPRPPMIQRVKQVYDPNIRKVVWTGGVDDAE